MAPFLPIRATSRSQGVRIGKQKVKTGTTTYVDLASQVETAGVKAGSTLPFSPFKELQNHLAIGAVFVAGPVTASNSDFVVVGNGVRGTATLLKTAFTAGELYQRNTGTKVQVAAEEVTTTTGKNTEEVIDLISVSTTTGKLKLTGGVFAAEGKAIVPATPAGEIALATATNKNKAAAPTIADISPRA